MQKARELVCRTRGSKGRVTRLTSSSGSSVELGPPRNGCGKTVGDEEVVGWRRGSEVSGGQRTNIRRDTDKKGTTRQSGQIRDALAKSLHERLLRTQRVRRDTGNVGGRRTREGERFEKGREGHPIGQISDKLCRLAVQSASPIKEHVDALTALEHDPFTAIESRQGKGASAGIRAPLAAKSARGGIAGIVTVLDMDACLVAIAEDHCRGATGVAKAREIDELGRLAQVCKVRGKEGQEDGVVDLEQKGLAFMEQRKVEGRENATAVGPDTVDKRSGCVKRRASERKQTTYPTWFLFCGVRIPAPTPTPPS